jgi:putative phage-type endonuclease
MNEQRTAGWFADRCGKVTASRIADVMACRKDGKPMKARDDYMAEVIAEQLTGDTAEHFVSKAMQWGIEMEPEARSRYEVIRQTFVEEVGFIPHPTIEMAGASPDGLVGDDGLVEIKCPTTATHIKTLIRDAADPQYLPQMQWQLACTGRKWCDFVSFDPRLPDALQVAIYRVERDEKMIAETEEEVRAFLTDAALKIKAIYKQTEQEEML